LVLLKDGKKGLVGKWFSSIGGGEGRKDGATMAK